MNITKININGTTNNIGCDYANVVYSIGNTIQSAGGTLSLDGTTPLYAITLTGNVSALELSSNPPDGHSCHIIFTAESEYTVLISYNSVNRVTPTASDAELTVPAGGYVEVDFLAVGNKIYVRGV